MRRRSRCPTWNDLVIYEMHVGTFAGRTGSRGDFDRAAKRLPYLAELGVGAIQVMPPFEFAGDVSWGYNPAHLFSIDPATAAPTPSSASSRPLTERGSRSSSMWSTTIIGPSDLDLWRFDGWSEGDWGGIYFYNDERAVTPWGNTRPDYGRGEVRTFLRDSALTWLEEFRCDGLRFDATAYIRMVDGGLGEQDRPLPDGWTLMSWMNDDIRARQPWKVTIAEDLRDDPLLVTPTADGGAGFSAQWDAGFLGPVRDALTAQMMRTATWPRSWLP